MAVDGLLSKDGRLEACATIVIALVVISSSIWLWLQTVVSKGPGPAIWPVLGSAVEMKRNYRHLNDWFLSYFSEDVKSWKYRLPFPFSQTVVATVDPVVVEYILTNYQIYGKGNLKMRLGDFLGSGIFLSDGDAWRRHRKIASSEFSTRKLREHSNTVFREDAVRLANVLNTAMAAKEPVDFQNLVLRMTLDGICKVAFGVDLGCISPSLPDVPFAMAFDKAQWLITRRLVNPFFKIERALDIGSERQFRKAITVVNDFAYDVIHKRRVEIDVVRNAGKEFTTKEVLTDDVLPGGIHVKKGDSVQYITYSMSRMPFIWGSDALEMKPERWLKDGVFQSVSTFQFTVFQGGPRICLGRDSAFLQLKVTLALLTHFFIFRLVPGHEIEYDSTFVMPVKNGLQVTLSPRH